MYIEQGYRGRLGLWKYFILPAGIIALGIINYISIVLSPISVEEMTRKMIAEIGKNTFLALNLAFMAVGLVIVLGWTKLVHPQSIRSLTTSRRKVDWGRIFFAFWIWGLLTVLQVLIAYWISPEDYVWNFNWDAFWKLAVLAILLVPLQTSFEEYLFRGHMMQGLGILARNRWVPLLITSVLFGMMHLGNPEVEKMGPGIMVFYIGTGFFLGIITLMDEGLELALGFHAANNLVTALLVTADWTAFQTDSILLDIGEPKVSWDAYIPIFVIFPLLLYGFGRKYGWTDWKEKLFGRVLSLDEAEAHFRQESE